MKNAKVQLHTLLANAYLRSGNYRLARIYVERVCGPLACPYSREKFPLQIENKARAAAPFVYAQLLLTAAKISIHHGRYGQASQELAEAIYLDPCNAEVFRLREECHAHWQRRRERLQAENERFWRILEKKFKGEYSFGTQRCVFEYLNLISSRCFSSTTKSQSKRR